MKQTKITAEASRRKSVFDRLEVATGPEIFPGKQFMYPPLDAPLSAYGVFHALSERFGKPNMAANDKLSWAWVFKSDIGHVMVFCAGREVAFGASGDKATPEQVALVREIVAALRSNRPVKASSDKRVGGVILNPYRLYAEMAMALEKAAETNRPTRTLARDESMGPEPEWPESSYAVMRYTQDYMDELRGTKSLYEGALLGALIAHILSLEAFLNVVYHLFLRPELNDDRMKGRLDREQLDLKLRLVGIYCSCFEVDPIKTDDEEFKAFCFLVDLRNNLAHAKVTAAMEESLVLEEDRYQFVVPTKEHQFKYGISSDISRFTPEMIRRAGTIAWAVVSKLLRAMKSPIREAMLVASIERRIYYYRNEDGTTELIVDMDELRAASDRAEEVLASSSDLSELAEIKETANA